MNLDIKHDIRYSDAINKDYRYINISDIHSNAEALQEVLEYIKNNIDIDFLTISGDTLDTLDNENNRTISTLIEEYSKEFPIFICLGNRDTVYFRGRKEVNTDIKSIFNYINRTDNITVLENNDISEYEELLIRSFNLPTDTWYQNHENSKLYKQELLNNYKIIKDKLTILLSHSPNGFIGKDVELSDYNEVLKNTIINSGHMHGGFVPFDVQEFMNDNLKNTKLYGKGLVGPYGKILPNTAYGTYHNNTTSLLITGGITKAPDSNPTLINNLVNKVLPPEINLVDIKSSDVNLVRTQYKRIKK